jgi:type II secretion system protein I
MKQGFSLMEVLVALTIASLSLAALARSARTVVQARRASERQQVATLIGEQRLEELIATGADSLAARRDTETIDDGAGEFRVETRVERGPNDTLWLLAVDVAPSPDGAPVRLQTLLRRSWGTP